MMSLALMREDRKNLKLGIDRRKLVGAFCSVVDNSESNPTDPAI